MSGTTRAICILRSLPWLAMPTGDCFHCHKPGHWANRCPLKSTTTITTVAADSPPVIHCPCDRACVVLTSRTVKNPNRRFYKCSAVKSPPLSLSSFPLFLLTSADILGPKLRIFQMVRQSEYRIAAGSLHQSYLPLWLWSL